MTIRPIIGLEIHVQLATRTKMFCRCPLEFAAEPNSLTCPVCLGMPGTLPVMNRQAVEFAIKAGLALGCKVAPFTKWDRKSYYYPDMPKNYQISQYDLPLSADGAFEIVKPDGSLKKIGIIRAHLEEDAGKNLHEGLDHTRVDLNRAGTPLLEIVTKPDLTDADEAYTFCVELQRLVRYLGISEANMQKGQMRFEPNVNVAITEGGKEYRTPISEVKNLNSFRSVRSAIQYEINRQVEAWKADHDYTLDKKGKMNFGWDDVREVTEFQRGKEESHDYRYFPDPDLVPVRVDDNLLERLGAEVGELPSTRERRFIAEYGMSIKDCEIILGNKKTADSYELSVKEGADPKLLTKQFMGTQHPIALARNATIGDLNISATSNSTIVGMISHGEISPTAARQLTELLIDNPGEPRERAKDAGLLQVRDESATLAWVEQAFAENPQAVADALSDNPKKSKAAPGFLRGQIMKVSQGKADPKLAGELIERKLREIRSP